MNTGNNKERKLERELKVALMRFWLDDNIDKVAEDDTFRRAHYKALLTHAMKHLLVAAVCLVIMLCGALIMRMSASDGEYYLGLFVRFLGMWGCLNYIMQSSRPFAWAMSNKSNSFTRRFLPAKTVEYYFEKYNSTADDDIQNDKEQ